MKDKVRKVHTGIPMQTYPQVLPTLQNAGPCEMEVTRTSCDLQ